MTLAFVLVAAPFLILSSHILLTIFRHLHMPRSQAPMWSPFLIFTLLTVIVFGVLTWVMVGKTLSPIRDLATQASSAGAHHPGVRLTSPSDDAEMQELVDTLNSLLNRIEDAAEERGRFYVAASHELRTPLQALAGHLEVTLSQPRSPEELAIALTEAQGQTQRLSELVNGVLLLHQLQGVKPTAEDKADLESIVRREVDSVAPLLETRAVQLQCDLAPTVVLAWPTHADILVRNLIENAVKYCREGSQVKVQLDPHRLRIHNDLGEDEDFNPDWLARPFSRKESSRSAKRGGNGLGLAICRAVAIANGWTLRFEVLGGGLSAIVEFEPEGND